MDDLSHTSLTESESDSSLDYELDGSISSENNVLWGLGHCMSDKASRLTLKLEQGEDCCCCKIMVGMNTYLPLDAGRSCYSFDITSASNESRCRKKALHHLISQIISLAPCIRQLDLEGFGGSLDIEDVFEAFAEEELSPWRTGRLEILRTWNCDMNSKRGNKSFYLAEDEYPLGLEEVYVHNPKGSVLSSSIFRITSRSKSLCRFYVFDGFNKNDRSSYDDDVSNHHYPQHQSNGSRLTKSSIDALCEVLSATNRLREMNQLPFRELLQLPEDEFSRILEATTKTFSIRKSYNAEFMANLRFPIIPPAMVSRLTVLASRSEALRFYLLWKRSLEILRNPSKRCLSPMVLQNCQKRKSMRQYISYSKNDLIFAMLQDSLEGILNAREARCGQRK